MAQQTPATPEQQLRLLAVYREALEQVHDLDLHILAGRAQQEPLEYDDAVDLLDVAAVVREALDEGWLAEASGGSEQGEARALLQGCLRESAPGETFVELARRVHDLVERLRAYAAASGVSAEDAERREVERVLATDPEHFRCRNREKAEAGVGAFKAGDAWDGSFSSASPSSGSSADADTRRDGRS